MKIIFAVVLVACGPSGGAVVIEAPPPDPLPPQSAQIVVAPSVALLRSGEVWVGKYECAQGVTELILHIDSVNGDVVDGVFEFAHGPSNAAGAYRLRGSISPAGQVRLAPGAWMQRPQGYVSVGMSGEVRGDTFNGRIDNESCGNFMLRRH